MAAARGRPVLFLDIDQTLLFSERALARLGMSDSDIVSLPVGERWQGRVISRYDPELPALLAEVGTMAELVPITTRSRRQYARVAGIFSGVVSHALVANGEQLLVGEELAEDWTSTIPDGVARRRMDRAVRTCRKVLGAGVGVRTVARRFAYLVSVDEVEAEESCVALTRSLAQDEYSVTRQGRKVYLMPRNVSKGRAAERWAHARKAPWTAAVGDAELDVDLLRSVGWAGVPKGSVAARVLHGEPHISISASTGVRAPVELLSSLLAELRRKEGHPWT